MPLAPRTMWTTWLRSSPPHKIDDGHRAGLPPFYRYVSTSRGEFVGQSLAATPVTVAAASLGIFCGQEASIHILGGTGYPGPKTVEAAFARGHEVTIFNRGKREKFLPFPYQNVEHLHGNCDPLLPADDERGPDKALLQPVAVSQRKGQGGGSTGVRRGASE